VAALAWRARAGAHGPHPRGRRKPVPARPAVRSTTGMAREGAPRVVPRVAADAAVVIGPGLAGLLGLAAGGPPDEQSDEDHQGHFEGEDQPDRRTQRTGNPRARRAGAQMGIAWSLRGVRTRAPLVHDAPGRHVRARLCGREPTARARPGSRRSRAGKSPPPGTRRRPRDLGAPPLSPHAPRFRPSLGRQRAGRPVSPREWHRGWCVGTYGGRAPRCSIAAPQRGRVGGWPTPAPPRPSLPSRAAVG
jgi:hypothetical protein